MNKKWKILIIVLLLLISYSTFEISKIRVQIDFAQTVVSPYNIYKDFNRRISLLDADDTESVKEDLMELSDNSQVSFALTFISPSQENNPEYYWYLQDDKYLSTDIGLNKSLDLETFNALESPMTNHNQDEYHFDFPLDTYNYKIYPFNLYDKSNLSNEIVIFAESEQDMDQFINGLEEKGLVYIVIEPFEYQDSFLQTILLIIFQNPLAPLTFGLLLIVIFTFLYQDRRNLSIKLVNGYSKTTYILENIREIFYLQIMTIFGGFFLYYLLTYYFKSTFIFPILSYYIPIMITISLIVMTLVAIIVYSFTDINQTTYVQGVKPKIFTSYIIGISKFGIGLLVCILLIPSISDIIHSVSIYKSMSRQMSKYSDVYVMDSDWNYTRTMLDKSDEIIEALQDFDNIIYISHFTGGKSEEVAKLVRVNDNYIKRHPILDENKEPIDPNRTNVVYTKAHNVEGVEGLKPFPGFLCQSQENCLDVETIILDDDAELTMYNIDPLAEYELISQDFILVPQNEGLFISELFFIFENNDQIEEVLNQLEGVVDIESVYLKKVTDGWEYEVDIYRNSIIKNLITFFNYLILMVILSLIYYQIKLDKVRKEFSIYWVNGISKFNYFYIDYLYQLILSGIMIFLVKAILYPQWPMLPVLIVVLIYIFIDTLSLAIFRYQFYTQLQKSIKEEI